MFNFTKRTKIVSAARQWKGTGDDERHMYG